MPKITFGKLVEGGHASIDDIQGTPVFDAALVPLSLNTRARWGYADRESRDDLAKRVILRSSVDNYTFGSCRRCTEQDVATTSAHATWGGAGLAFCHHSEALFGVLQAEESGGFVMRALDGWTIFVHEVGQERLQLEDGSGWVLAEVEASTVRDNMVRVVKIQPMVDAGLISLLVLGIDVVTHGLVGD